MKLDITSGLAEKAVDGAKSFLGLISKPAAAEFGLMLKDKITEWRFHRELKMIGKVQEKCEKLNIKPKNVSFKLLAPLIEYSSLEEDDEMLDNWANLLSNLVDSEQNIQNHVFPYLLSQISKEEWHTGKGTV